MKINPLIYPAIAFFGFSLGRVGHIVGGQVEWIPHHWLLGLIIVLAGLFLLGLEKKGNKRAACILMVFGLGLFVSDFRDFLLGRVWELDDVTILKFWAID